MSYDEPTRRVPARQPVPPAPPHDDLVWREELVGRLSSLRTALALVALLATVALGLSLYALFAADDDPGTRTGGASSERVAELEDRVDRLDGRVDERATEGQLEDVRGDLDALEQRTEEAGGGEQALEQLREDVDTLRRRVDELEQQPPPPQTTTTP